MVSLGGWTDRQTDRLAQFWEDKKNMGRVLYGQTEWQTDLQTKPSSGKYDVYVYEYRGTTFIPFPIPLSLPSSWR